MTAIIIKLREIDGVICADTLDIARDFRKRHDHVLDTVDAIVAACQALEPTARNLGALGWFRSEFYYDAKQEKRRRYDTTEEGFALVVGRYSGKDALEWQIAYHTEFQRMKALLGRDGAPAAHKLFEPNIEPEPRDNIVAFQGPPRPQSDLFAPVDPRPAAGGFLAAERAEQARLDDWRLAHAAERARQEEDDPDDSTARSTWHHEAPRNDNVPALDNIARLDRWTDTGWPIRRRHGTDGNVLMVWITPDDGLSTKRWWIPGPSGKSVLFCFGDPFPPIDVVLRTYDTLGPGPYAPAGAATLRHYLA